MNNQENDYNNSNYHKESISLSPFNNKIHIMERSVSMMKSRFIIFIKNEFYKRLVTYLHPLILIVNYHQIDYD